MLFIRFSKPSRLAPKSRNRHYRMPVQVLAQSALSQRNDQGTEQQYSTTARREKQMNPRLPRIPNAAKEPKYVLTFLVNRELQETMDAWRQQYYPANLNRLPAHLMAFHALPERYLENRIIPDLQEATKRSSYRIAPGKPMMMGKRGVALKCFHPDAQRGNLQDKMLPELKTPSELLYRDLQQRWWHFLSDQDRATLRLHWTVSNKVDDGEKVSEAYAMLLKWAAREEAENSSHRTAGRVHGLTLWRYEDGYWKEPQIFPFEADYVSTEDVEESAHQSHEDIRDRIWDDAPRKKRLQREKYRQAMNLPDAGERPGQDGNFRIRYH